MSGTYFFEQESDDHNNTLPRLDVLSTLRRSNSDCLVGLKTNGEKEFEGKEFR